ncbi:isocitrate lyase/PEP mutase family protein [Caenimonas soli]|uniref:isocitrate lyase/PEP mutase family protein n=1 Tax=Caenimonas soli TaxID=2735555 RepID=UPI001553F301|nr:isocitrate lyase/phosphoenolpyruvate mutase family protein [Caenimonas soli]NPC59161.1 isocitrate lyase/phosphoenolpyruvate mutase family protein [Caenimonas soli]
MSKTANKTKLNAFRALHESGLLVLANVWDAGSARLSESLGAKAVATTSAGMAWAAGYADGNNMPADLVVAISQNIVRAVKVPVTIDIEGGYSSKPKEVGELSVRLAEAGVVGVNLEDGEEHAELLARKIEAVKAALAAAGLDLFVNARTDVYLAGLAPDGEQVAEVLRRAKLYEKAGTDGLFVPGLTALPEMREISGATKLPLNVMAWGGLPAPDRLSDAGVRRLSAGAAISGRVWAHAQALTKQFLEDGKLGRSEVPSPDMQGLFS